jgi:murein DD-endopeptidase MepM/ murein hydrolase activator NlpD
MIFQRVVSKFSKTSVVRSTMLLLCLFGATSAAAEGGLPTGIVFPVISPKLSSKFGNRIHPVYKYARHHSGIDLAVPEKTHVRAVLGGRVVFAGVYAGYGKLVTIEHSRGTVSMYGHLSEFKVNCGQVIKQGQIIGRVGSTGISTGPHLHFEWRQNGETVDPLRVFPSMTAQAEG